MVYYNTTLTSELPFLYELCVAKFISCMENNYFITIICRYYSLAHAVNEKVVRQPSMLRAGTLRDYQLVGHTYPQEMIDWLFLCVKYL